MGWEYFGVVGLDLGSLLQGQMRIAKFKSTYKFLIIDPRGLQYETNSYEILGWEFLILDLTFGPSFKVKRWFTGFVELSFRWIQTCIGSPMRRSSSVCSFVCFSINISVSGYDFVRFCLFFHQHFRFRSKSYPTT